MSVLITKSILLVVKRHCYFVNDSPLLKTDYSKKACEEIGPDEKMDSDDMNHISVQDDGLPNNPPKYTTFEPDLTSTVFNARSTSTSVISLPPKLIFTLLIIMLHKWSH
ncbi:hypothetical protein CEXT_390011 [Caerostris extrusa]|uniref:Uncharacterized protein n=1 Tax=Caerostris extrusa TaxID=172846 RepID=A0AAV4WZK8_CAEEX|nr:hypothetical protein CEXT_390011 [Caerostris extrusa]